LTTSSGEPIVVVRRDAACRRTTTPGKTKQPCGLTERLKREHYADEEFRRSCLADWPDDDMPAHEDPPHDRDRFLPVPRW
jgi:hypothetical protein